MHNSDKSYFALMQRDRQLENALKNSSEAVTLRSEIQTLMTDVYLYANTSKKGEAITN
jgi:predicted transcriptional regulator